MRRASLLLLLFISLNGFGQSQPLLLRSGTYEIPTVSDLTWTQDEVFDGHFFRIIAFQTIPTNEEKARLENAGITLKDYLPRNAFYASIAERVDWNALQNATVLKISPEMKQSEILKNESLPESTLEGTEYVHLIASYYPPFSLEHATRVLASVDGEVLSQNAYQGILEIRFPLVRLTDVFALQGFYYFETLSDLPEPENLSGRTNHRSNTLWTEYAGGLSYNGSGVNVMMQDDGIIGPHIDYTGRIDQSSCASCSTDPNDTHGDHVSGTIMGAGNLNPEFRGMAHGVDLKVYSSSDLNYSLFPGLFDTDSIVITSKSYSNGCNAGYTSLPRLLDQQVHDRPELMHVFSAGNSGTDDCGYGAGAGWGNITGGHKIGKNVIAVGNLSSTDVLAGSSSRGPAEDGRIKPDICAVGSSVTSTGPENIYFTISGTSMACPGVSGTIAQLYEGYKDMHGGTNPEAALIKSSILNTAEDLGNPGPDFKYGWGRINARRAFDLISNSQYLQGSVSQGVTNSHSITVPSGVKEVRIMTYWTDFEGSTSAALALVNDLNMVVTDPGLVEYNPWVLDVTPTVSALNAPAVRAIDGLNNMEQVTILDPASGTYVITIQGFAVPQGPQNYYIVYYFITDEITVTYPIGGEGIAPGSQVIRWDAPEGIDPFDLEYTTDNGVSWTSIGSAPGDRLYANWTVPNTVSGLAKVRVSRNGFSDESDAVFSMIGTPSNLEFSWICPDSAQLSWDAVSGATGYEISMLGAKYMDSIGTSATTNFTVVVPSSNDGWFSVRALGPDDARGERAVAIQKPTNEINCTWSTPYAAFSVDCESSGVGHCFDFTDESINSNGVTTYSWYFPGGIPATSAATNPTVCYATPGDYDVALVINNGTGIDSIYQTGSVHVVASGTLPYVEGFEAYSSFVGLDAWEIYNPDNNQTFAVTSAAAHSGSKSARILNYTQTGNFTDELISGPIDLSVLNASDTMTLSFRYAYRKKLASNDEWLRVSVRSGCEDTWVVRKTMHGDQLSALTSSANWTPGSPSDWTTVHMTNITGSFFSNDFRVKFGFESDSGNNFYLDDINIYQGAPSDALVGLNSLTELSAISVYPVPASDELNVSFSLSAAEKTSIRIVDMTGKTVQSHAILGQSGNNIASMNVSALASGIYMVEIATATAQTQERFVIQR